MENRKPLISVITINYNNTEITGDFLESVRYVDYDNIEVIVVDNASKENPSEKLREIYPAVNIILSKKNFYVRPIQFQDLKKLNKNNCILKLFIIF